MLRERPGRTDKREFSRLVGYRHRHDRAICSRGDQQSLGARIGTLHGKLHRVWRFGEECSLFVSDRQPRHQRDALLFPRVFGGEHERAFLRVFISGFVPTRLARRLASRLWLERGSTSRQPMADLTSGFPRPLPASTDWVQDPRTFTTNQVIFIVGSYTFTGSNDISQMWINPNSATFVPQTAPAPSLVDANGGNISSSQIASFVFTQRSATESAAMANVDELRIGTPGLMSLLPPRRCARPS